MKQFYSVIVLLAIFSNTQAQQWDWAKNVISPVSYPASYYYRNSLAPDGYGNFYVGTNSDSGACIIKFDTQGNELWQKCFTGAIKIYGITAVSNDLYVSGSFENSVNVYSNTLSSAGMNDIFFMRLTLNGNFIWVKTMGGTGDVFGNGLTADKTGNIYLTGEYSGTAAFGTQNLTCTCTSSMFMAKFDSSGNINLLKSGGCILSPYSFSRGKDITVDDNGNIFILGTYSYFSLDTFQITGGGGPYPAWFICKLNSVGNVLWAQYEDTYYFGQLFKIINDADGNVLITGYRKWTNGGSTVTKKYNSNGQLLWNESSGGNCYGSQGISEGIATDGNSSYIFGRVGWGGNNCTSSFGGLLIIKYDSIGGQLLYDTIRTNSSPFAFDIIRDSNGDFIVCGFMQQGSLILGNDTLNNLSNLKLFIAKFYGSNSNMATHNIKDSVWINIYPNPSSGILTICFNKQTADSKICVYDVLGNCVLSKIHANKLNQVIDMSNQPKGIYFVQVVSEEGNITKKIIIQ